MLLTPTFTLLHLRQKCNIKYYYILFNKNLLHFGVFLVPFRVITLNNIQLKTDLRIFVKLFLTLNHFFDSFDILGNILHIVASLNASIRINSFANGSCTTGYYSLFLFQTHTALTLYPVLLCIIEVLTFIAITQTAYYWVLFLYD